MNVLLVLGHPRTDSLAGALARAYREGAEAAGATVQELRLESLRFDPDVRAPDPRRQALEPDLERAKAALAWARHLVFVYPTWWGTMPARLKGFLDRLVLPGFAFEFVGPGATEWEALWRGKSAQLITTMDTPPVVYRWLFRAPGLNAMKRATLGFCGVAPVHCLVFGPVRTANAARRARWIARARRAGFALRHGVRGRAGRLAYGLSAWVRALRLQFYPMAWGAYSLGALASASAVWNLPAYAWGFAALFLLEAATVFANEWRDFGSDRANRQAGPFNGGSRVAVNGQISLRALKRAVALAAAAAVLCGAIAWQQAGAGLAAGLWLLAALPLTLGYSLAPLRLSYRGLGELDVAFTHSIMVLAIGYSLQAGAGAGAPWLLGLPLFFAILPSISLSAMPDRAADAAHGKGSIAVLWGSGAVWWVAACGFAASALLASAYDVAGLAGGAFTGIGYFALPHAALALLWLALKAPVRAATGRIDGLLLVSLTYILWFVAVPLYWLL